MPCDDGSGFGYNYYNNQDRIISERKNFEAMLCGVLTYAESKIPDILDHLDYKEMGIGKTIVASWWTQHKAADQKRRKREQEEKDRKARYEQLKQTLSPEDLKIIKEHAR